MQDQRPLVIMEFGNEVPRRTFGGILPDGWRERTLRIDPLRYPGLADGVVGTAEQAAHWAERITAAGPLPVAVLAYCSAVGLASALVEALPGPDVPLIVLDPAPGDPKAPQELLDDLALAMDESAEVPTITGLPSGDALTLAGSFLLSVIVGCSPGLDEEILVELTEGQRAWLSFTLTAAVPPQAPPAPTHVLLSEALDWPGSGAVHRVDVTAEELFHAPAVKVLLTNLLATGGKEEPCSLPS
ncbi:hypothetical protein HET69_07125 [Streptomyces sp. CJ_13]|uniref:hypothetical protein n=1 Tax=Streptomyces TaxID=1883 RepID=UPI000F3A97C3|nr:MULTISPECIES: hypothetical protein [unclassified Streptomyces]AYV31150.1 hypothetical protein EES41_30925 [Streptomyces sp. ADI95-16]MBT1183794.1 hypothetical protein [Streptomyces sp. CJ_13]